MCNSSLCTFFFSSFYHSALFLSQTHTWAAICNLNRCECLPPQKRCNLLVWVHPWRILKRCGPKKLLCLHMSMIWVQLQQPEPEHHPIMLLTISLLRVPCKAITSHSCGGQSVQTRTKSSESRIVCKYTNSLKIGLILQKVTQTAQCAMSATLWFNARAG